jgi:serine/threonine protein kinase
MCLPATRTAGFVHGDVRRVNIFIRRDCTVKVGDFGFSQPMKSKVNNGKSDLYRMLSCPSQVSRLLRNAQSLYILLAFYAPLSAPTRKARGIYRELHRHLAIDKNI